MTRERGLQGDGNWNYECDGTDECSGVEVLYVGLQ
jgi:hypothetical protein